MTTVTLLTQMSPNNASLIVTGLDGQQNVLDVPTVNSGATDATAALAASATAVSNAATALAASENVIGQNFAFAGGASTATFAFTGITSSSICIPVLAAATTALAFVTGYIPSTNSIVVTFNADPGASTVSIIALKAPVA